MSDEDSTFFPSALHVQWPSNDPVDNEDSAPAPCIALNIAIRDLLPDRVLWVTAIDMDKHGLNVHYEVAPPINPRPEDVSEGGLLRYTWYLAGRDDLGNQYDTGGGAYGLATDGQRTKGVHSLTPVPAEGASWLDIAFYTDTAGGSKHPFESALYILRVNLPLERP